jgi:hypothetical protein
LLPAFLVAGFIQQGNLARVAIPRVMMLQALNHVTKCLHIFESLVTDAST